MPGHAADSDRNQWFGGAIKGNIEQLYSSFEDASNIRQVPDHQEVFVDVASLQSLIVELNEQIDETEAVSYYFQQLAIDNAAIGKTIETVVQLQLPEACPHLPKETQVYMLCGTQQVAKFNETAHNTVAIIMALVRLKNVATDLLITLNIPVLVATSSSETAPITGDNEGENSGTALNANVEITGKVDLEEAKLKMTQLVKSIQVIDWKLFG